VEGLGLLQAFIRPEVLITQGKLEDDFFLKGVETHSHENGTPHIGLTSPAKDFLWIAFLDSTALQSTLKSLHSSATTWHRTWKAKKMCYRMERSTD
jgi:hypothetical protein